MPRILLIITFLISASLAGLAKAPIFIDIPSSGTLRTSTVHTFLKDSEQLLWIGTDKEIIAFDGNNSAVTAIIDNNNLPAITYAFVETANHDILAATSAGLYKIDFTQTDNKPAPLFSKKIKSANCLAVTASDSIIVGTDNGIFFISPNLKYCSAALLQPLKIRAIAPDGQHAFLATDQGVYSIDLATKRLTLIYGPFNATALLRDSDRLYAASCTDGLAVIDLTSGAAYTVDVNGAVLRQLDNDSDGNIYIATDGDGILMLRHGSTAVTQMPIGHLKSGDEHNNQIYSLMIDKFDRMHVGYYLMGAEHSLLSSDAFSMMPIPGISHGASVRAVHADGDKLMVGTRNGAFFIDNASGRSTHITKEQLGSGLVLTIEKHNGKYAIGTYGGGLSIFDPKTGSITRYGDRNLRGSIFSLSTDKNGDLWMGTSSGIYKTDGEKTISRILTTDTNDSLANIYTVFFDSSGRGWAASALGTYTIDTDKGILRPSDRITDKDVRQIYETRNHDLWVVTNSGRITVYKSDLQKSDINNLVSTITDARGVVEDEKGRVWITTTNGLYKCSPFDEALSSYGFADGIPTPMFNSGAPKIGEGGTLYLCHTGGLLTTDLKSVPDGVLSRRKARPSFVTDANGARMLSDRNSAEASRIDLLSNQKMIKLSLTDAAFAGSEMARYEYSLDNGNSWMRVGPDMNITLSPIDKATLGLKVRQIGNPLTETEFTVNNPESMSLWLWLGLSAAIILIVSAGWLYTIYVYKKRHSAAVPGNAAESSAPDTPDAEAAGKPDAEQPDAPAPEQESKKYAANYLSEKECAKIAKQAKTLLQDTKLYTDPDLKIATIAEKIGVSSHKLSYVFSQHLHTSYYDYIYQFRVEEFKRLAQADKKQAYTLVALSEKAGFNSRATFFRAFKKFEGVTPGDYLRQLRAKE